MRMSDFGTDYIDLAKIFFENLKKRGISEDKGKPQLNILSGGFDRGWCEPKKIDEAIYLIREFSQKLGKGLTVENFQESGVLLGIYSRLLRFEPKEIIKAYKDILRAVRILCKNKIFSQYIKIKSIQLEKRLEGEERENFLILTSSEKDLLLGLIRDIKSEC